MCSDSATGWTSWRARPDAAEAELRQRAEANGLRITEIRRSQPTLENAFVGQLRQMRGAQPTPHFPNPSPPRRRSGTS